MYNFISTFDELNKLYEEVEVKEACNKTAVEEDGVEESFMGDAINNGVVPAALNKLSGGKLLGEDAEVDEVEEGLIGSAVGGLVHGAASAVGSHVTSKVLGEDADIDDVDEPRQIICECDKCGALVIKDEADLVVDENTDLVNVEEACKFCEEAAGFKIVGVVAPYEAAEQVNEAFGLFNKKPAPWKELKAKYDLVLTKATDFKKGDWLFDYEEADDIPGGVRPKVVTKVELGKASDGSTVAKVLHDNGGVLNIDPEEKCFKVVKKAGVNEDLADVARKVFDKPASIATQQAWEDELNDDSISPERRKQLEKKFAQQRDWEAKHPDKEVK